MNKSVEAYLIEGCGRCPLGGTSECKVHKWIAELALLREIVLDCGLTETCKWGVPCYTVQDKNVIMISAYKEFCSISFLKGSLLSDPEQLLESPGKNSQAVKLLKFTNIEQIEEVSSDIQAYIQEAIEIEKAGLQVIFKKNPEAIPEELENKLEEDAYFRAAFEALTPGRQRGYIIFFSAPKQSKTREARIEKCMEKILNGEGMHDKYRSRN